MCYHIEQIKLIFVIVYMGMVVTMQVYGPQNADLNEGHKLEVI